MKLSRPFVARPVRAILTPRNTAAFVEARQFSQNLRVFELSPFGANPPVTIARGSDHHHLLTAPVETCSTSPETVSKTEKVEPLEETIEKVIYRCRFLTILAVFGSLVGSFLCFVKGCAYVVASFTEYVVNNSKVILLLVEAIDVYLLGTVMLVFGMGLYELFVSNLGPAQSQSSKGVPQGSNLFGLFTLKERPRWLEIKSVNELKTKLGHVIVMLLLIGFFEKSAIQPLNMQLPNIPKSVNPPPPVNPGVPYSSKQIPRSIDRYFSIIHRYKFTETEAFRPTSPGHSPGVGHDEPPSAP